ncbi:MAG: tetratricopeptide repeat protein [Pirellulaceae bacterium]|nr:tetratricopeptide repeat protein [Pirellulaceae bacterium]
MQFSTCKTQIAKWAGIVLVALLFGAGSARADELNELSLDGWKQLREVERYQLQIAEKYWREQNWKIAGDEYAKFMELYESSTGAPYAQLKWSLAQVQLRKQNTAIKEGFQSVIDYWPDSPQATAAAYYIGRTHKDIGRVKEAKSALKEVVAKHPQTLAAVYALNDLIDITTIENDLPARVELWKRLVFDIKRNRESSGICVQASQQFAAYSFREGAVEDGVKALATTYNPQQLPAQVAAYARQPISDLTGAAESKLKGDKLADGVIAWLKTALPTDQSTPEAKQLARSILLSVADLTAVARRDDAVPAAYEAVLKNSSPDDEALGRLAAWHKAKSYDKARETYRRYADKFEGLGQVANSYREQAKYQEAVETYQQVASQDEPRRIRWKSELAYTYRLWRKIPEAVAVYEELYKEDTAQPGRWRWEIAITYRDAGQYAQAIGNFRQCDNFPENYKQMAWCHRQAKQWAEAIILYGQVAGNAASAPWALLQVAYTREEAGQAEQAIQAFQLVCKRFPKDSHAATAHAHLQQKYKISVTLGGATQE